MSTASPSIGRSMRGSWLKSVWRAQTGSGTGGAGNGRRCRRSRPGARPGPSRGRRPSCRRSRVGSRRRPAVKLQEPARRARGRRTVPGRHDQRRRDQIDRRRWGCSRSSTTPTLKTRADSRPATRSVSSIRRRVAGDGPGRRRAGPSAGAGSRCRAHRASRVVGLGQFGAEQAGPAEHRATGPARPSGRRGTAPRVDPVAADRSSQAGSMSSSPISSSRIGRPVQSRYRWRNPARVRPLSVDDHTAGHRLHQRGARVLDLERLAAHPRACVSAAFPGDRHELLAEPRGRLARRLDTANAAGLGIDLDLDRLVAQDPVAGGERRGVSLSHLGLVCRGTQAYPNAGSSTTPQTPSSVNWAARSGPWPIGGRPRPRAGGPPHVGPGRSG